MNKRALVCAAVTLVAGLALFRWGSGPVRSSGGDVLIVVLITALFASVRLWTPRIRIAVVLVLGVLAECIQLLGLVDRDSHWLWHLTLGSTFDPWDIAFYGLGGVVALGAEWAWDDGASSRAD